MQTLLTSLIKRGILFLELKQANAPSIILETEEKFINEKIEQFYSSLATMAEEMKNVEIDEVSKCSPCYLCKNAFREKSDNYQPLKCKNNHLMDDNNIENRVVAGCLNFDKDDSKLFDLTDEKIESINKKYSSENLKKVIKFICNKILTK